MMKEKNQANYVTRSEMIQSIMNGTFDQNILNDCPRLLLAAKEILKELREQNPNFSQAREGLAVVEIGMIGLCRMSQTSFNNLIRELEELAGEKIVLLALAKKRQVA